MIYFFAVFSNYITKARSIFTTYDRKKLAFIKCHSKDSKFRSALKEWKNEYSPSMKIGNKAKMLHQTNHEHKV
jgi:hypothetical protein